MAEVGDQTALPTNAVSQTTQWVVDGRVFLAWGTAEKLKTQINRPKKQSYLSLDLVSTCTEAPGGDCASNLPRYRGLFRSTGPRDTPFL